STKDEVTRFAFSFGHGKDRTSSRGDMLPQEKQLGHCFEEPRRLPRTRGSSVIGSKTRFGTRPLQRKRYAEFFGHFSQITFFDTILGIFCKEYYEQGIRRLERSFSTNEIASSTDIDDSVKTVENNLSTIEPVILNSDEILLDLLEVPELIVCPESTNSFVPLAAARRELESNDEVRASPPPKRRMIERETDTGNTIYFIFERTGQIHLYQFFVQ
ncbi:unnamed protein product, partial [Trichogramma brassicae]